MLFHVLNISSLTYPQRDYYYYYASLIQPIFLYNIELWFNYATVTQKEKLLHPIEGNDFYLDVNFFIQERVKKAAMRRTEIFTGCLEHEPLHFWNVLSLSASSF